MLPVLVQPARELEPLALAAGQRRQRLPQRQVAQPDVDDRLQPAPDVALCRIARGERLDGGGGGEVERVGDRPAVDGQGQHLVGVAAARAVRAGGADAVEEGQVRVHRAQAVAGGAGSVGVEAEQPGLDAVRRGVELAQRVHHPGPGRRRGADRGGDGRLVDDDRAGVLGQQHLPDQGRLARPGDAGDRDEYAERDVEVEPAQVVRRRVGQVQVAGRARGRCP